MTQEKMTPPEMLYTGINQAWFGREEEQRNMHFHIGYDFATESLANKLETLGIHSGCGSRDVLN